MPEEQKHRPWLKTVPGILTAIGGVITAVATLIGVLSQSGVFGSKATSEPPANLPTASTPAPEVKSQHPAEQTTDGWTIIGKSRQGKFFDLNLMVHGDSPAIGRRYDAVKDFRLVQKRREKGITKVR